MHFSKLLLVRLLIFHVLQEIGHKLTRETGQLLFLRDISPYTRNSVLVEYPIPYVLY